MEIELRVEIKQKKTRVGDYLDLGIIRLVWIFFFLFLLVSLCFFFFVLFLWAFDSSGLIQIDADYSNPNQIRFILPKAFLSSHYLKKKKNMYARHAQYSLGMCNFPFQV